MEHSCQILLPSLLSCSTPATSPVSHGLPALVGAGCRLQHLDTVQFLRADTGGLSYDDTLNIFWYWKSSLSKDSSKKRRGWRGPSTCLSSSLYANLVISRENLSLGKAHGGGCQAPGSEACDLQQPGKGKVPEEVASWRCRTLMGRER